MNERKQHCLKMAHQLFIEKGFQATSIQDILDASGISKGTFYNYFSSKNELLIALFRHHYKNLAKNLNEFLIGQDPSNIDIFVKQIEYKMEANKSNKLGALFDEVYMSNDEELKQFMKDGQLRILRWLYKRFLDLFGEEKKPYLLDCSIMFMGMLQQNYRFYSMEHLSDSSIHGVVRYSVERIVKMVYEVSQTGDVLIQPEFLDRWLPESKNGGLMHKKELVDIIAAIKKQFPGSQNQAKYVELLDFIQNELFTVRSPRIFLIESALMAMKKEPEFQNNAEFQKLEQLVESYIDYRNEKQ